MLAQLETGMKIVDKASEASDRWLFIAALAIIIVGGTLIINWLVKSLDKKDAQHDVKISAMIASHATERKDWAGVLIDSKTQFLEALATQRKDFREELSLERHACAQERSLDREARHATANALNNIGLKLTLLNEEAASKP